MRQEERQGKGKGKERGRGYMWEGIKGREGKMGKR